MTPAARAREGHAESRDLRSLLIAALATPGWERAAVARVARAVLSEQGRGAPSDAKAPLDALRLAVSGPVADEAARPR